MQWCICFRSKHVVLIKTCLFLNKVCCSSRRPCLFAAGDHMVDFVNFQKWPFLAENIISTVVQCYIWFDFVFWLFVFSKLDTKRSFECNNESSILGSKISICLKIWNCRFVPCPSEIFSGAHSVFQKYFSGHFWPHKLGWYGTFYGLAGFVFGHKLIPIARIRNVF